MDRRVGTHLEDFSVSRDDLQGHISPGSASAHPFKCLKKLEFPLNVVMCNIEARDTSRRSMKPADNSIATSQTEDKLESSEICLKDLIPPSLRQLSLLSYGINGHQDALKVMFRRLSAQKKSSFPLLAEVFLACPDGAHKPYKTRCTKLIADFQKLDISLKLVSDNSRSALSWYGAS